MAHFLSELGMMHYATLKYFPSMVAASAVFAARCTLNKAPLWTETLKLHTGYSQGQLMYVKLNGSFANIIWILQFIIIIQLLSKLILFYFVGCKHIQGLC